VYRARSKRLQRDVAIKVLPDLFAADPERLARFEREAQVLASLNHPHIAAIYGLEESQDVGAGFSRPTRALILELVEGDTLAEPIAAGGPKGPPLRTEGQGRGGSSGPPIPIDEALSIARQIAEALEAGSGLRAQGENVGAPALGRLGAPCACRRAETISITPHTVH